MSVLDFRTEFEFIKFLAGLYWTLVFKLLNLLELLESVVFIIFLFWASALVEVVC